VQDPSEPSALEEEWPRRLPIAINTATTEAEGAPVELGPPGDSSDQ